MHQKKRWKGLKSIGVIIIMKRCYSISIIMLSIILLYLFFSKSTSNEDRLLEKGHKSLESITTDNTCADIDRNKRTDIIVNYISETGYHVGIKNIYTDPYVYACWEDVLILGENIYRRENDIYEKTGERLGDWLNAENGVNSYYQFRQWKNLLIAEKKQDHIIVFDMDTKQLEEYPFTGYAQHIYQGKLYYREFGVGVLCMDVSSGEREVIYECDGGGDLMIRDNGDIIINKGNNTDSRTWEFWRLRYDEFDRLTAEKIWETQEYKFITLYEYNKRGLFMVGESIYGPDTDFICLKDDGETEMVNMLSYEGQIIGEEGYFLWDSQIISENEKTDILTSYDRTEEALAIVDSVSYYDFHGKKSGTWRIIEDEMLEAGYRLICMLYHNSEILAFYVNENSDDLYISKTEII